MDELIVWLNRQRGRHVDASLKELIGDRKVPAKTLIELAAIDLIGQRRRGIAVTVESYLTQFPALTRSQADVLDLIDAELCVRREMGETCHIESFQKRFTEHADAIRQLFFLQTEPELAPGPDAVKPNETLPLTAGEQPEIAEASRIERELSLVDPVRRPPPTRPVPETDDSIDVPIPIAPPAWMVGARCVATSIGPEGRHWLVKGRDAERGEAVAMKIIPMPSTIGRLERTRILDLCEASSAVSHPVWLAPRIAAINNGHLAVVRPWIFGNPPREFAFAPDQTRHLRQVVRLAFALAAAHRVGATHGGVHRGNLILDHQGDLQLIDVVSSVSGWRNYLAIWDNDLSATLNERIAIDTSGLCRLLTDEAVRLRRPELLETVAALQRKIDLGQADAGAQVGEAVQAHLDGAATKPPKPFWRFRSH
jgi:hypothetical protein